MLMPVPDREFMKMRYVDIINNISVTAGTLNLFGTNIFYQTSLYKPRADGSPHQPMWYDQIGGSLYAEYTVHGIAYKITVNHRNDDAAFYLVVRHQNTTTAETSLQAVMERNDSKWRMGGGWAGSKGIVSIKGYISTAKTLGQDNREISSDPAYSGSYSGPVPTTMAYLFPYLASAQSVATEPFDVCVELIYYCTWQKRSFPASS